MRCACTVCRPACPRAPGRRSPLLCDRCDRALHRVDGSPVEPPGKARRRTFRKGLALRHSLSARQVEVLDLLWEGLSNDEAGARLGLAENTVKAHLSLAYRKLGVGSKMDAFRAAGYMSDDLVRATSGAPVLNAYDVAKMLAVHVNTIKRIPPAELPFFCINERGDRRYRREDVESFIQSRTHR